MSRLARKKPAWSPDPLDGLTIPQRRALEDAAASLLVRRASDARFVRATHFVCGRTHDRADIRALEQRGLLQTLPDGDFVQITAKGKSAANVSLRRSRRFQLHYGAKS